MAKVFSIGGSTISYGGFLLRELGEGSLTISKTVSGSGFDPTKTFELTVVFSAPVTYNGTTSTTHVFNLAHGQSVTITGIPELTEYEVTETPLSQADAEAGYSISGITGGSGTIANNGEHTAAARNAYNFLDARTAQFQFSDLSYDPSQDFDRISYEPQFTWTRVSSNPNIWNYHKDSEDWSESFVSESNSMHHHFYGKQTGDITLLDANLYGVTDLDSLFQNCTQLKNVVQIRNTESVTDTHNMFTGCSGLTSVPLFDTGNVTRMDDMFSSCSALTTCPLFDTGNVTRMQHMFEGCSALTTCPLFNTEKVTNMRFMFNGCESLVSAPNFNTSRVTDMKGMFMDCVSLQHAPAIDTSNVTNISFMFSGNDVPLKIMALKEVPAYNVSSLENVEYAFHNCRNVSSGALSMYQRMAALSPQPSPHTACFYKCGSNTTTGAAELAQIPSGWKSLT